jgi:endonuclease/exonuclease/phosphatase family metal-dependent hydrolase
MFTLESAAQVRRFVRLRAASGILVLILGGAAAAGCTTHVAMALTSDTSACRQTTTSGDGVDSTVRWLTSNAGADRARLSAWCDTVGPAVVARPSDPLSAASADELAVVSWNTHVGGGDLDRLVADLRAGTLSAGRPAQHFVLLLQEVFRSGSDVPGFVAPDAPVPHRIAERTPSGSRDDIVASANRLGLSLYYVPSMRNGRLPAREDRGNAILSTLPLSDLEAIELPLEGQRRVAVGATVGGVTRTGAPWRLRVSSAHFDARLGARRLWWLMAPAARARQAQSLLSTLPSDIPIIVGGDFNTWLGTIEPTHGRMLRAFANTPLGPSVGTLKGLALRLDRLFFRLPRRWTADYTRLDDAYGSDHYPLLGTVRLN